MYVLTTDLDSHSPRVVINASILQEHIVALLLFVVEHLLDWRIGKLECKQRITA